MTGLVQTLSDLKLIASTDRRVWAASSFVLTVVFVWITTGSWRPDEEPVPEDFVKIKVRSEKVEDMIAGFNKDMRESQEERNFLKDYANRLVHQFAADKEEMDWHVNTLISRLGDMTEKVDDLAVKIGDETIKKALFNQKLKRQKKQLQKKRNVDPAEL